ncbi:YegP family protein [Persicirhabdus sediminis]|uniref:YegP family protein n=1 Tax=Persicirhabdus sediminis TaxID=454144 RepID=A0A8J7MGG9_9BACT|nr:YegP family protein [Persicirhabdus sediminis]MBK1792391.1 YegP family protein [Persicirhabdus sediminis]
MFEIYQDANGFLFRLVDEHNELLLTSAPQSSPDDCEKSIETVRKNCNDLTKYELKCNTDNKPFFILKDADGQTIAQSPAFQVESNLRKGMSSVTKLAKKAEVKYV